MVVAESSFVLAAIPPHPTENPIKCGNSHPNGEEDSQSRVRLGDATGSEYSIVYTCITCMCMGARCNAVRTLSPLIFRYAMDSVATCVNLRRNCY